jgi:hypothetical protein
MGVSIHPGSLKLTWFFGLPILDLFEKSLGCQKCFVNLFFWKHNTHAANKKY